MIVMAALGNVITAEYMSLYGTDGVYGFAWFDIRHSYAGGLYLFSYCLPFE